MPKKDGQLDNEPTPRQRLLAFAIYVVALWLVGGLGTGVWRPTAGGETLWFVSGIGLWLFATLGAPFFVRPRDALANAATVLLLLLVVDLRPVTSLAPALNIFRWLGVALALGVGIAAGLSIWLYGTETGAAAFRARVQKVSYRLAVRVGDGPVLFTPPALLSIVGFHQQDPIAMLVLSFTWVLAVSLKPIELMLRLWGELRATPLSAAVQSVGRIERIDSPDILRVNLDAADSWKRANPHVACLVGGKAVHVIPLFVQTQDTGLIGTGLCCGTCDQPLAHATPGHVYRSADAPEADELVRTLHGGTDAVDLIGFVVEKSTISTIRFEVASDVRLREGILLFVRQQEDTVYYQILDAETAEETFSQNPRGTQVATAAQLGVLDAEKGFVKYGWVPAMNTPVFRPRAMVAPQEPRTDDTDTFVLGKVPDSRVPVRASLTDMFDFHTAILGVTGTGKTELAFDIIAKVLQQGAKVFCVDFTGEYEPRLLKHNPQALGLDETKANDLNAKLFAVETGSYGAKDERKDLKQFLDAILPDIQQRVDKFLTADGPALGIFSLPEIANTKATLRATELYLSSIFNWARKHRKQRRVVVVLEEAHTIIPEGSWSGFDSDTQWTVGRIGQIALQGRKYGVGLLILSQRTALVSKTLLSQCNTCIAFAMYDKTGLDYLSNVFSSEHVRAIPNLKFLQGIAFGKAIRSDRPVIFEIPVDDEKRKASEALNERQEDTAGRAGEASASPNDPEIGPGDSREID